MRYLILALLMLTGCTNNQQLQDEAAFHYNAFSEKCKVVADTLENRNFEIELEDGELVCVVRSAGSVFYLHRKRLYEIEFYLTVLKDQNN